MQCPSIPGWPCPNLKLETLLPRLHHAFGISDTALSWFWSYLFDRTQVASVNGNSSSSSVMKCGVLQGSVLGPILFVLYTQPLSDIVHHHSLSHRSFSDDNQLFKSGHILQLQGIIQSTQCCISDLKDWMINNKLQLNEDKTDMILISARKVLNNAPIPSEICLNGTNIKLSQNVRNLGVTLDRHSFISTTYFKRLSYLLSWAPQN